MLYNNLTSIRLCSRMKPTQMGYADDGAYVLDTAGPATPTPAMTTAPTFRTRRSGN
jgi:hypothetical protein